MLLVRCRFGGVGSGANRICGLVALPGEDELADCTDADDALDEMDECRARVLIRAAGGRGPASSFQVNEDRMLANALDAEEPFSPPGGVERRGTSFLLRRMEPGGWVGESEGLGG